PGRARNGPVGAVGVLQERQGQDRRPVEDLHDRVRVEGEVTMGTPTAPSGPAIELINVSRRFLTHDGKSMTAIRDFTMTVNRGEFVAVVGPTGCGKSTTLNLVTGLASPSAGEVRVMGGPVNGIDPRIGFVFQTDALFPWRNVLDNVVAGPLFRGVPREEAYASARQWLARVNLAGHETKYPHQLSGGMRKRVSLAQTFINGPQILLM